MQQAEQQQQQVAVPLGSVQIGSGTTNQQRLKSHVQQFVNRIKKESDAFYKEFVQFCKNRSDTSNCLEFHEGLGEILHPYGDLLGEMNRMLHGDYQFEIPAESINTTLKTSKLANPEAVSKNKRKQAGKSDKSEIELPSGINASSKGSKETLKNDDESRQNVRDKFKQFCQIINEHCPSKMTEFVQALKNQLDGQDGQMKLFIQTCTDFFSDHAIIYKEFLNLFAQQIQEEEAHNSHNNKENHNGLLQIDQAVVSSNQLTSFAQSGQSKSKQSQQLNDNEQTNKSLKNKKKSKHLNNSNDNAALPSEKSAALFQSLKHSANNTINILNNGMNSHQQFNAKDNNNLRNPSTRMDDLLAGEFKQSASANNMYNISNFNDGTDISAINQKNLNIPGATKDEQNFIYLIDNHMDPIAFMNMQKLLYLYLESIITANEMVEQGSYLLQGFANPEKLVDQLKELVDCRENSRRKATPFFKPLNDLDFNNHERFTHSYVEMPRFYPKYCSNSTELTRSVLNTSIVTVPQGTEHVTFSIMRKNQYEEQLFKSEDEKYEFDRHIQMYRRTIKTLEQIEQSDDPVQCRKLMQLAIDLKMLVCLYKNGSPEQHEICEILMSNPKKTVVVALERVRAKLHDIEEAKVNQAKKLWHEVAEKNFHRSLDHRSFIFKRHDRKFTLASRFEKEPEFRNKVLAKITSQKRKQLSLLGGHQDDEEFFNNLSQQKQQQSKKLPSEIGMGGARNGGASANKTSEENGLENSANNQDFEQDPVSFFQFLNTFQGTTNVEKCSHAESEQFLMKFDYMNEPKKFTLPMMTFIFENEKICSDAFSLLLHYQGMYAPSNIAEKAKIKKTALIILKGLFGLNFQAYDPSEYILSENKTIKIVTEIENKIFEKIFAYLKPAARENGQDGNNDNQMEDENNNGSEGSDQDNDEEQIPQQQPANFGKSKNSGKNAKNQNNNNLTVPKQHQDATPHSNNSLNEILEEGEDKPNGQSVRETAYWNDKINENIYQPSSDSKDMQTFYGTKSLYVFLRFFYVLYERLLKAHEISNSFEENEKTKQLTTEEKLEISRQRYHAFMGILLTSLKTKENKYEDFLRSIFGKQAFLLFTIDKTLQAATKSLQALSADELTKKILPLFFSNSTGMGGNVSGVSGASATGVTADAAINPLDRNSSINNPANTVLTSSNPEEFKPCFGKEEIIYAKINKIVLESNLKNQPAGQSDHRSFFRFSRHLPSNILYINYMDSYYKNWENDTLTKTKEYFKNYTISPSMNEDNQLGNSLSRNSNNHGLQQRNNVNSTASFLSSQPVFLSRNKLKNQEKICKKLITIHQTNNIEYVVSPNTTHLLPSNSGKEDVLISSEKLKRKATPLEYLIAVELHKKRRFDAWIKPKIDSIVSYKKN